MQAVAVNDASKVLHLLEQPWPLDEVEDFEGKALLAAASKGHKVGALLTYTA